MRLKNLLWPDVASNADVDYLTTQGFWICFLVALEELAVGAAYGNPTRLVSAIFFYFGANGIRLRSRIAAVGLFVVYALGMIPVGVLWSVYFSSVWGTAVRSLLGLLLLANLHAIWIAAKWPVRPPLDTSNKLSGRLPGIVWPKTRYLFFVWVALRILAFVYAVYAAGRG
jgi:hypothetical protein